MADIVAEIAAASAEQASGIDQVNAAVTQMDEMTQQNAALVEESAAAADALEEQSRELNRLMDFRHRRVGRTAATATTATTWLAAKPAAKPAVRPAAKPATRPVHAAPPPNLRPTPRTGAGILAAAVPRAPLPPARGGGAACFRTGCRSH